MPRFEVLIGRDMSEYATVIVVADDDDQAAAQIEAILESGTYCELVDCANWSSSGGEASNERVVDVTEIEYHGVVEDADTLLFAAPFAGAPQNAAAVDANHEDGGAE